MTVVVKWVFKVVSKVLLKLFKLFMTNNSHFLRHYQQCKHCIPYIYYLHSIFSLLSLLLECLLHTQEKKSRSINLQVLFFITHTEQWWKYEITQNNSRNLIPFTYIKINCTTSTIIILTTNKKPLHPNSSKHHWLWKSWTSKSF